MRISLPAVRLAAVVVGGLCFATAAQATWTTGLYDGFQGAFHLKNTNASGGPDVSFTFGPRNDPDNRLTSWKPVAGDWDRDLNDSVGLYNPNNGTFHLRNAITTGPAGAVFRFGPKPPNNDDWLPIAGDWDGDGTDTVGLFNPRLGRWFLKRNHQSGPPDVSFVFGPNLPGWTDGDWLPVVGDWNGDGRDSVGLYDQVGGLVYLINNNANGAKLAAGGPFRFGSPDSNLRPVAGNWNGEHDSADQREKIGLYFPDRGGFNLKLGHQPGPADISFNIAGGRRRMLPISGNWDGAPNLVDERNPASDGAGGFVWKPFSDHAPHNLVVILPNSEFGSPHYVDDCTAAGIAAVEIHRDSPPNENTFVEAGCFTGNANGDRPHYRFTQQGPAYGQNIWLMVFRTNGDIIGFFIPDGGQRVD